MEASFTKAERLTGKKIIEDLFRNGASVKQYPFVLLWKKVEDNGSAPARLAISVPKRRVKLAVNRNRIKRLVRESYRTQKQPLYQLLKDQEQHLVMLLIFVGTAEETNRLLVNEKISGLLTRLMNELSPKPTI